MKYYCVRNGRIPGIYDNWCDCKAQVDKFKGAEYKSFSSEEDAKAYMYGKTTDTNQYHNDDSTHIYVDGSSDYKNKTYACGVVILHDDQEIQLSAKDHNAEAAEMNNVAGELFGTIIALKYAVDNNLNNITIHYDYNGIKAWATHEWRTNNWLTKNYQTLVDNLNKKLSIKFEKSDAHTGDYYNEICDRLAKRELSITVTHKDKYILQDYEKTHTNAVLIHE